MVVQGDSVPQIWEKALADLLLSNLSAEHIPCSLGNIILQREMHPKQSFLRESQETFMRSPKQPELINLTDSHYRDLTFFHLHQFCLSENQIPEAIGAMVNLTSLRFEHGGHGVTSAAFQTVLRLQALQCLYLEIDDRGREPSPLAVLSTKLTKLKLTFSGNGKATSVSVNLCRVLFPLHTVRGKYCRQE